MVDREVTKRTPLKTNWKPKGETHSFKIQLNAKIILQTNINLMTKSKTSKLQKTDIQQIKAYTRTISWKTYMSDKLSFRTSAKT